MHQHTPGIHEQLGRMRQAALLDEARADQAAALVRAERRSLRSSFGSLLARRRRSPRTAPAGSANPIVR